MLATDGGGINQHIRKHVVAGGLKTRVAEGVVRHLASQTRLSLSQTQQSKRRVRGCPERIGRIIIENLLPPISTGRRNPKKQIDPRKLDLKTRF